jgi:hypothetical protein
MIIKLILNTLELDLSNYESTFIEENNWLKDNTISKFTYPLEIELTNDQSKSLGNITEMNLTSYNTLLVAKFYVFGEEHEAVLEIESLIGRNLVAQIRYGLEEFPNYNKRLSELPLENFELAESIYTHAEAIIRQTWPAVNYNFPQVITDALDTDSDQWRYFEGIINKYADGDFIENSFDNETNEQINRNVMLPMPYLLYVLQVGFADVGATLSGDILEDTYYKKATLYALNQFYTSFTTQSEIIGLTTNQYTGPLAEWYGTYFVDIVLPEPGRYKIAGNVNVRVKGIGPNAENSIWTEASARFRFNNNTIWSGNAVNVFGNYIEEFYSVDFNVDYTGTEGNITFFSQQLYYSRLNGVTDLEASLLDVTLTQLAKIDVNGNFVSTLVEVTTIDLTKSVPDMSFGEFATAVMKKRNYGYDIIDNEVIINKKKIAQLDNSSAFNLSTFEVATPEINFNRGKSFVFKTFEYTSDEYISQKIFINNDGFIVNNFTKNDDTEEIIVNAIELPLKTFGVRTAHGFLDDFSKVQLVIYAGLTNSLNLAESAQAISHLNNYLDDYEEWFNFLLTSLNFNWVFNSSYEKLAKLKIRSIIYAYNQYFIIRKLTRKTYLSQRKGVQLEVDIETESLK